MSSPNIVCSQVIATCCQDLVALMVNLATHARAAEAIGGTFDLRPHAGNQGTQNLSKHVQISPVAIWCSKTVIAPPPHHHHHHHFNHFNHFNQFNQFNQFNHFNHLNHNWHYQMDHQRHKYHIRFRLLMIALNMTHFWISLFTFLFRSWFQNCNLTCPP